MSYRQLAGAALSIVLLIGCGSPTEQSQVDKTTDLTETATDASTEQDGDPAQPAAATDSPVADDAQTAAEAESDNRQDDPVYAENGIALDGTDPVAYFTQGQAVAGSPDYTYRWRGVTWQFSSSQHRDQFVQAPERYAPAYGGFCAWAVSQGYTAAIDPNAWRIVDDRLYLNFDLAIQRRWERDIPGHIQQADQNWPALADSL
jgi:YHS domain-containing protein